MTKVKVFVHAHTPTYFRFGSSLTNFVEFDDKFHRKEEMMNLARFLKFCMPVISGSIENPCKMCITNLY